MRELIELQTGQVAFISGLMSGFSLSVAAHVLRYGIRSRVAQAVFLMLLLSSLLFLLALYTDVRLGIELAGVDSLPTELAEEIGAVRSIGTTGATVALFLFVVAVGLLGWLATPLTGALSTVLAGCVLYALWTVWSRITDITTLIGTA